MQKREINAKFDICQEVREEKQKWENIKGFKERYNKMLKDCGDRLQASKTKMGQGNEHKKEKIQR